MIDSNNKPLQLENLTWPDLSSKISDHCFIMPVGSVEQHGPHLPLGTDTIIPVEIARIVAGKTNCIVMPPIHYGITSRPRNGGGRGFPGHTSVSGGTLMAYVKEILEDMVRHGTRKILVLSWHFENSSFLYEAIDAFYLDLHQDCKVVLVTNAPSMIKEANLQKIFPEGFPGWDVEHASILETSLMMVLRPELVDKSKLIADGRAKRSICYDIFPPPQDIISETGVLYKSKSSSLEKGKLALEDIVSELVSVIESEFFMRK